jgi:hypothetical protein
MNQERWNKVAVDRELWIKMKNEGHKAEKIIHLLKNSYDPKHPWSIMLRNIINDREVEVWNVADSFEEGLVRVKEHLDKARELGYTTVERRT